MFIKISIFSYEFYCLKSINHHLQFFPLFIDGYIRLIQSKNPMNSVGNRESKLLNAYILHLTDLPPILLKSNHPQ